MTLSPTANDAPARAALWAMVVGFSLRVLWALLVPVDPVSDSAMYDAFARSIAAGHGYSYPEGTPTAFWPVGTAAVYGVLYLLFGISFNAIVVLHVVVGSALIWLTYRLADVGFGHRTGVIAAWIVATWPLLIQFTTVLASELLFTVLLLAALCAWSLRSSHWALRTLIWAALMSAAMYMRPTVLPLFVALPLLQLWRDRNLREALGSLVVVLLTAAVLIGPWAVRNQALFGKPVLVSTNFGANLWMGNNPNSEGAYMPLLADAPGNEVEQDAWYRRKATDFIRRDPLRYVELTARRFFITFSRETIGVVWNEKGLARVGMYRAIAPLKVGSTIFWWAVAGLSLVGLALAWRRGTLDPFNPILLTGALLVAVPLLTVGQDRYHIPLNPLLAIFAAHALASLWRSPSQPPACKEPS